MVEQKKLELARLAWSETTWDFLVKLRFIPEIDGHMEQSEREWFGVWLDRALRSPKSVFLAGYADGEFCGVFFATQHHPHSYECHFIFRPGTEFRRWSVPLGRMAVEEFWRIAPDITHVFSYTPAANLTACRACALIGFEKVGVIPGYAIMKDGVSDVNIYLNRRK